MHHDFERHFCCICMLLSLFLMKRFVSFRISVGPLKNHQHYPQSTSIEILAIWCTCVLLRQFNNMMHICPVTNFLVFGFASKSIMLRKFAILVYHMLSCNVVKAIYFISSLIFECSHESVWYFMVSFFFVIHDSDRYFMVSFFLYYTPLSPFFFFHNVLIFTVCIQHCEVFDHIIIYKIYVLHIFSHSSSSSNSLQMQGLSWQQSCSFWWCWGW